MKLLPPHCLPASARPRTGFGVAEMMIAIAILIALSALMIPRAVSAKLSSNEHAALQRLRAIHRAQMAVQTQRLIDATGSYATLGELTGELGHPLLATTLQPDADGVASVGGYRFQVYLPDTTGAGMSEQPERRHPALGSIYWCAYAWPDRAGATGRRAFVIDANGEIQYTANKP